MTERLKGIKIIPRTEAGWNALSRSFDEEKHSGMKEIGLFKGFWTVTRDSEGTTFTFRRAGLAAMAATMFTTAGRLRRFYEKNIEQLTVQFHDMMNGCGATSEDYDLEEVWR